MSSKEGKGTVKIYYKIGEEADFTIGIALCMVYFYIQNTDAVKHRGKRDTMRVKDFFKKLWKQDEEQVVQRQDTVERVGKDIEFYRCDPAACDEVVFRMKQVRNACVNEK